MSTLDNRSLYRDKDACPMASPIHAAWRCFIDQRVARHLKRQFMTQAKAVTQGASHHREASCRTPEQTLVLLWSDDVVRSFFDEQVQYSGEAHFLAAVLGVLEGYFVELDFKSNQAVLVLAALCFSLQGRSTHIVFSQEDEIENCKERYALLFSRLDVKLEGQKSDAQESIAHMTGDNSASVVLTLPQQLMADYVAATPYRESDFHHKVISSHFGEKSLLKSVYGIDVVLVDRVESILLDDYLRPLTLHRPRELQGFHETSKALLAWSQTLIESDYYVEGLRAEYIGEQALLESDLFQNLTGFWRSERILRELSTHVLSAVYAYKKGRDYDIRDEKLCVLNPDTGDVVLGKMFPEWIRQGIEVKEGLNISPISEVLLRKSYQAFFRERMHLAGTGSALSCSRRELFILFQGRLLNLSDSCRAKGQVEPIFFAPQLLLESVSIQLKLLPSIQYLICTDSSLIASLESMLNERTAEFGSLKLITSIKSLHQLLIEQQSGIQADQVLAIGLSATGRVERCLEQLFTRPVNRMLSHYFIGKGLANHLIPKNLLSIYYAYCIRRQARKKRAELLSEQLRILKSEYGLRDQWI